MKMCVNVMSARFIDSWPCMFFLSSKNTWKGFSWGKSLFGSLSCPQLARVRLPLYTWTCVSVNVRIVKIISARSLHSLSDYLLIECPLMFIVRCTHTCTNHEVHMYKQLILKVQWLACYVMGFFYVTLYTVHFVHVYLHSCVGEYDAFLKHQLKEDRF